MAETQTFVIPENSPLKALGFTERNLTSIAGRDFYGTPDNLGKLWGNLEAYALQIENLMKATGLKASNFSSMLNGCNTPDNLDTALLGLFTPEKGEKLTRADKLCALILTRSSPEGLLDPPNVSTVLNAAAQHLPKAVDGFYAAREDIAYILNENIGTKEKPDTFTNSNFSSILSGSRQYVQTSIGAFKKLLPNLKEIRNQTGLSCNNIAAMLSGAGANIQKAVMGLYKSIPLINEIKEETGLTAENIASMLNSSGANIQVAVKRLHKMATTEVGNYKNILAKIMDETDLSLGNISSITHSSGVHIASALEVLDGQHNYIPVLAKVGFSLDNVANMLGGKGRHLDTLLPRLCNDSPPNSEPYLDTLRFLLKNNIPSGFIARQLNKTRNIESFFAALDKMVEQTKKELEDGVVVHRRTRNPRQPKESRAIAATSPAAVRGITKDSLRAAGWMNLVMGMDDTEKSALAAGTWLPTEERAREVMENAQAAGFGLKEAQATAFLALISVTRGKVEQAKGTGV